MATVREAIQRAIGFQKAGRLPEAQDIYRRVLQANPREPNALHMLGLISRRLGRNVEAAEYIERAIEIQPASPFFHANHGTVLFSVGRHDDAIAAYERALEIDPAMPGCHSNLLLAEQSRPGVTPARLATRHAEWFERHARPHVPAAPSFAHEPDPDRKLRVGFVSPDLWTHPVGIFLVRVLESIDRDAFDTVCYSHRERGDELTDRLRDAAGAWRDVIEMSDDDLDARIRADGVDLLFDLAGHTAAHRLLVFARRPAPVQLTWAGYVGTTGIPTIDYVLADRHHVPETDEPHYVERVLRMPDGYVCFDPPPQAPEVGPLPMEKKDGPMFACFNNPSKLNDRIIGVWSRILERVPAARVLFKYRGLGEEATVRRFVQMFKANGIDPRRLEFTANTPRHDLLARYNDVDVALDPAPYSGGLTTCEALWMGVPVITTPGATFAGRHSTSHLTTVGLTETIATDEDDYVEIAVRLVSDPARLAALRASLRERVAGSPLCDGARFSADLGERLRAVWRSWCAGAAAGGEEG